MLIHAAVRSRDQDNKQNTFAQVNDRLSSSPAMAVKQPNNLKQPVKHTLTQHWSSVCLSNKTKHTEFTVSSEFSL